MFALLISLRPFLRSVYGPNGPHPKSKGFSRGLKNATALLTTAGTTMHQGLSLSDGLFRSIRDMGSPVKMRVSKLTAEQKREKKLNAMFEEAAANIK